MSSKFTKLLLNRRRTSKNIGSQIRLNRQNKTQSINVKNSPKLKFTPQQIQGHINKLNSLIKPHQEKDVLPSLNEVNIYQSRFTPEQITRRKKMARNSVAKRVKETDEKYLSLARDFFVKELQPLNAINLDKYPANVDAEFRAQENITSYNLDFIKIIARKFKKYGNPLPENEVTRLFDLYTTHLTKYRKKHYKPLTLRTRNRSRNKNILEVLNNTHYSNKPELLKRRDWKDSIKKCRDLIILEPNNPKNYLVFSALLLILNDYNGAEDAIRKAIELNPLESHYSNFLSVILEKKGDLNGAEDAIRHAIKLYPTNDYYDKLSVILEKKGDLNGAEDAIRRAIELNPTDSLSYFHRSNFQRLSKILEKKGDLNGAEDVIRHAIKLYPKNDYYYICLSVILEKKGDLNGGEHAIRHAIKLYPTNDYYNKLSVILEKKGDLNGAEDAIRRAIELYPKDGFYYKFSKKKDLEYQLQLSDILKKIKLSKS